METLSSSSVVPPEVSEKIESLSSQVQTLQKELSQALDIWQATIAGEKENFENLLTHKELAIREQDAHWERQAQAFEERLTEIKSEFEVRLSQTEQNATRALTELDDAWQRDKLDWGPASQSKWPAERRQLEEKIQALEEEVAQQRRQQAVHAFSGPTPETVRALQGQLIEFQQAVAALQDRAAHSDQLVSACVQAIDYQISVLYDLVQQAVTPAGGEDATLAQS